MRILALFIFLSFLHIDPAQQDTLIYWITFSDKDNSSFDVNDPSAFLSERCIERREKFNIPILEEDLPVNQNYIDNVVSSGNVWLHNKSKWFNSIAVYCDDTLAYQNLLTLPFVVSGERVKSPISKKNEKFEVLDKVFVDDYSVNHHFPFGKSFEQLKLHNANRLHELGFKGQGKLIAVIDAGFLNVNVMEGLEHLYDNNQLLSFKDFVAHDNSVYEDHVHGAAVLSIMAGDIEGIYQGTAPGANYLLLRTEDAGSEAPVEEFNWISAAEYADSAGADILNTSLGYTTFDDSTFNHSYSDLDGKTTLIAQACNLAHAKGMLVCNSAGNSGSSDWGYISTPADADSAFTIGAVDSTGRYAPFSSYGPSADGDLKPNSVSVGWNTYFISPYDNRIVQANGTSFSSPMMAGMAACLWQALPDYSNGQIKRLIESVGSRHDVPDTFFGHGYPDMWLAYTKETGVNYQPADELFVKDLYPNPIEKNQQFNVEVVSKETGSISIEIVDITGKKLQSSTLPITQGRNLITLQTQDHPSGIYQIIFDDGENRILKRLIIRSKGTTER